MIKKINKNLPSYMVPEEFIYVKKFVYNNNGKLIDNIKMEVAITANLFS